jgi:hypothetical protein
MSPVSDLKPLTMRDFRKLPRPQTNSHRRAFDYWSFFGCLLATPFPSWSLFAVGRIRPLAENLKFRLWLAQMQEYPVFAFSCHSTLNHQLSTNAQWTASSTLQLNSSPVITRNGKPISTFVSGKKPIERWTGPRCSRRHRGSLPQNAGPPDRRAKHSRGRNVHRLQRAHDG